MNYQCFVLCFSVFYGLFSECCDENAVFVKDYSTDLLFPLIMKWNNEALVFIHLRHLDVFIYYFSIDGIILILFY